MECKGLFFRCEKTSYITLKGVATLTRMHLLKRISCGCAECMDLLSEIEKKAVSGDPIKFGECEDKAMYQPKDIEEWEKVEGDK